MIHPGVVRIPAVNIPRMAKAHPGTLLLAWLVGVAGVRLFLAVTHPTFLGIDGGAYFLGMYQFWGDGPEQVGLDRAPLAPGFLLVPFVALWGVTPLAYNLYAALGSLALLPGGYLLARRCLGPGWGALAVVAMSLDWHQWTLMVTGVVPVLGFGLLCLALWAMIGASETISPPLNRHSVTLVAVIPFLALSSQTSAGLALVSLSVAWLMLPRKRELALYLIAGGLLAIAVAWPWYLGVLPGAEKMATPGPMFYWPPFTEHQWYQAPIAIAIIAISWRLRGHQPILGAIPVLWAVVLAHTLLSLVWSNDEAVMNLLFRSALWVTIPMWILGVDIVRRLAIPYKAIVLTLVISGAAYGAGWIYQNQFHYSTYMSEDVVAAADYVQTLQGVTRIGTNAESRAYWLSAYTGTPVAWVQSKPPAPAYADATNKAECDLGWRTDCATGFVSHWIIDTTHRQQFPVRIDRATNPDDPWRHVGASAPWLSMVWSSGAVQLWADRSRMSHSGS